METLVWATGSTFALAFVLIALPIAVDRVRRKRTRALELVPNCLLTRYPLVFVSGRRSLFYFLNYWNQIPSYLAEHGYEVEVLDLPWRHPARRLAVLRAILERRDRPCHLIADASIETELRAALNWKLAKVASVTMVECERREHARRLSPSDLKPRADGLQLLVLPEDARQCQPSGWLARAQALLLAFHNLFGTDRAIDPAAIGLVSQGQTWLVEGKYLEFAISLAERDLRC